MFEEVRAKIAREISGGLAFEELRTLHDIDRWFTFPAFETSAVHLARRWKSFGLSSRVEHFSADGQTRAGSWVMPWAWDVKQASLVIEKPEELAGTVLARYGENPTSLAMWSGPTPEGGAAAELVWVAAADKPASYKDLDLAGKIVFTCVRPNLAKGLAARAGAVGVVSDFVPEPADLPDATFWMNAWSDDPGGWALLGDESRIFGFNISPRQGAWLRDAIARHGRVAVRAIVDSRIYAGTLPAVTAVIPGQRRGEEVLAIGHAFEQGANDNASGVAVMLEAARALAGLIAGGALPPPRRTIRFLAVSECYTTFAWAERFRKAMQSTAAGICLDSVAERQDLCRTTLAVHRPPESNASFVTALAERLADVTFGAWRPYFKWTSRPYGTTDNVVSDPLIGPPTIWLGTYPKDLFWHTNADTLDKVDRDALGKIAEYAACYLYLIAAAGPVDALYFAAIAAARARAETSRAAAFSVEACRDGTIDSETAKARVLYAAERGAREVQSARSLLTFREAQTIEGELAALATALLEEGQRVADGLQRLMKQCGREHKPSPLSARQKQLRQRAKAVVPARKYIGTMAFDLVPPGERLGVGDPRWDDAVAAALFWCDGKRTLAEALELAGNELGRDLYYLVDVFEYLDKKELIELREA